MRTEEITIRVDSETARAYREASDEERRKVELLLSLHLSDVLRRGSSLEDLTCEVGRKAQSRGLTPAMLDSILGDD